MFATRCFQSLTPSHISFLRLSSNVPSFIHSFTPSLPPSFTPSQNLVRSLTMQSQEDEHKRYNFGIASVLDQQAYGGVRPGYQGNKRQEPNAVLDEEVAEWVEFMRSQDIKHVLSLLGDDEVVWYKNDIDEAMESAGFVYTRTSVFVSGALEKMQDAIASAQTSGERIFIHCSGGGGRASLGMGLWLVQVHNRTPEEAVTLISEAASISGSARKPNATKLKKLITNGSML